MQELKRLVTGFPLQRPRLAPSQVMWDLWTKWHWVSLVNHHSIKFSIIIITRGRYNRPTGGQCAEWTQLDPTPPLLEFKKKSFNTFFYLISRLTSEDLNFNS
jgi:hypothetical protein